MGRHKGCSPVGILQILVDHLTRMQPGYFCVAGVDVNTPRHIRPVLRRGRLTIDLLSTGTGPFDVGSVVDLGPATYAGHAPELEDHHFDPAHARWLFDEDPGDYWDASTGWRGRAWRRSSAPNSSCGTKAARWTSGKVAP